MLVVSLNHGGFFLIVDFNIDFLVVLMHMASMFAKYMHFLLF